MPHSEIKNGKNSAIKYKVGLPEMPEINVSFVHVQTLLKHAQIDFSLRSLNATEITLF